MKVYELLQEAGAASKQLSHLTHIEDLLFELGTDGIKDAINFLRSIRDTFKGSGTSRYLTTLKVDGCVHPDTLIDTDIGVMSIEEFINTHEFVPAKIKGYDFDEQRTKYVEVSGVSMNPGIKDWFEIELENNEVIRLTEDHEVFTNHGWVQAKQLTPEHEIFHIKGEELCYLKNYINFSTNKNVNTISN